MLSRFAPVLLLLASSCVSPTPADSRGGHPAKPAAVSTRPELGNRLRIRIHGREVPSITSVDYFVFLKVEGPDGRRHPIRIRVPESSGSEGLTFVLANAIEERTDLGELAITESLHTSGADLSEDVLLPEGWRLCFGDGEFHVFQIPFGQREIVADPAPEVRVGSITADGARYVEVHATTGPAIPIGGRPAGWRDD